jgi:predicted DNA-binding transcriptional regulator AlpA
MSGNLAYRLAQLASTKDKPGLLPVGPATIWRWVRDGRFPRPYTIGQRCTVWDKNSVDQWLATQRKGAAQ